MDFIEIEWKYLLADIEAAQALQVQVAQSLGVQPFTVTSLDTYYLVEALGEGVVRYRRDPFLQHLSIKAPLPGAGMRKEINLELAPEAGDQQKSVEEFLKPFGLLWSMAIRKEVAVFTLPTIELVIYEARSDTQKIYCVELEAKTYQSQDEALGLLKSYEEKLHLLTWAKKTPKSVFDLLCREHLPDSLKGKVKG